MVYNLHVIQQHFTLPPEMFSSSSKGEQQVFELTQSGLSYLSFLPENSVGWWTDE